MRNLSLDIDTISVSATPFDSSQIGVRYSIVVKSTSFWCTSTKHAIIIEADLYSIDFTRSILHHIIIDSFSCVDYHIDLSNSI